VVTLIGNTTEISTATLNQGAWTTLKIYPTKNRIVYFGNIAGSPIIDFNGADNVTLDGR
jgi:DMSO/TMAO reductase YedYZ molybdopterin-dependent catalytic subunit